MMVVQPTMFPPRRHVHSFLSYVTMFMTVGPVCYRLPAGSKYETFLVWPFVAHWMLYWVQIHVIDEDLINHIRGDY